MANRGEAADYYNSAPAPNANYNNYQMQDPKYGQQPPQYGQNYAPPPGPPPNGNQQNYGQADYGDKTSFEQAFQIPQGPKWHDLWAGILFIAVFLGYTAASGIAIQGYCMLIKIS